MESHSLGEQISFGPFVLAPAERRLTRDGAPVDIGGRSFDLLVALVEQPGRVLSKRELLKRVWTDVVVEDGSLRFHMAALRKILRDGEGGARYIATQVGVGYAFVAAVERQGPVAPASPRPSSGPLATNLPARQSRLIGRDRDVQLLLGRVLDTPLFTIVGAAGVGKTSLALDVAHGLAGRFESRVAFVDLAMIEDPTLVPAMTAGAMGIPVHAEDPLAVILGHVRDRPHLLVLDNCEHVVEAAARLVERLLDAAPEVRILATSREPLRVRDERVHRLDALAYPEDAGDLDRARILAYPAVELFCERARAADSSLEVDDDAARLIASMCVRLDGMALPIELAAVRVATHGVQATARQLGERFSLGWPGRRTAVPRQQTLQATLDWSYALLPGPEQRVLERLAIFVGPFSIDAALAVVADAEIGADAVVFALDELASKSLIAPDRARGTGTYRLLEMTRAYARQKLLARGELDAASRRHAGFFLAELEAIAVPSEDVTSDPRPLRQQLGNIRSALEWTFDRGGDLASAVRLAAASAPVFLHLSHLTECRTWCARALGVIADDQRGTTLELELQAALGIATMFTRGNSEATGAALARALEVATILGDRHNELRMLGRLHIFHERIGEFSVAMRLAMRAVAVAEALGEPEALCVAYSLSGISHHLAGNQVQARADLERSLAASPLSMRSRTVHHGFDHRNRSGIALARTLWLCGAAGRAGAVARQTVQLAAALDHPVTHCVALIWSLSVHLWMEELDLADDALEAFATCAEVNALGPYIAAASGIRGELAIQRGQTATSLGAVEESLARLRASRYELLTTPFSLALARGLRLAGRRHEALDLVQATLTRCDATGERFAVPELLRLKAELFPDDAAAAIALLEEAMTLGRAQGARAWELKAAIDLVPLLSRVGRAVEARERLETALAGHEETPDTRRARALLTALR